MPREKVPLTQTGSGLEGATFHCTKMSKIPPKKAAVPGTPQPKEPRPQNKQARR